MKKTTKWITILIFLFLYLPMLVLVVASFNTGKSMVRFDGFTFDRYRELFQDEALDVSADISVLQNMMAQDGLNGESSPFSL